MSTMTEARAALLRRAVDISLFTWRRAEPGDLLDDDERMGWWADAYPAFAGDKIGSRLWQLRRSTITTETMRQAEVFCREALGWMLVDELLTSIAVQVSRNGRGRADALITLTDAAGGVLAIPFDDLWRVLDAV